MTTYAVDQCELCGFRYDAGSVGRLAHLRQRHPAYARGVLFRVSAPLVFLLGVVALAALGAPPVAYLVAMFAAYALLFFGKVRSRLERKDAGARPSPGIRRLVREGGLSFVLVLPVAAALLFLVTRLSG